VEVAEDAIAAANDGRRLAIDERPERIAVARQDSVDGGTFIEDLGMRRGWARGRRQVTTLGR
jgi:hypothetical protein